MDDIGDLYDRLHPLLFTNRSRAIHYGFWGNGTHSFSSAQTRENVVIADIAGVKEGERILDAGAGIGGSAIWLATHRGARVVGISLGKREVAAANRIAKRGLTRGSARFLVADMRSTGLPDASFDLVWAIESLLYVSDKRAAAIEFARMLAPNGRVAIADLFLSRSPNTEAERKLHESFARFSHTAPLPCVTEMKECFAQTGFADVTFSDERGSVLPTSLLYLVNALLTIPIMLPFYFFWPRGIVRIVFDHARMALLQWRGLRSGFFTYGVLLARK